MIQYYNGIIDPDVEWAEMRGHYRHLLSGFFGDDPTRLVAGVCLSVCGDFDVTSEDALVVIQNLEALGTPTGGIFFWASSSNMYLPAPHPRHRMACTAACPLLSWPSLSPSPLPRAVHGAQAALSLGSYGQFASPIKRYLDSGEFLGTSESLLSLGKPAAQSSTLVAATASRSDGPSALTDGNDVTVPCKYTSTANGLKPWIQVSPRHT
jgi:hypothetical protein